MGDKPYWYPVLTDDKWRARLREDYPDKAEWTDDELDEYFNEEGAKYSTTWDHIGDAYNDYEPLADAYIELESKLLAIEGLPTYRVSKEMVIDGELRLTEVEVTHVDELQAILKARDE